MLPTADGSHTVHIPDLNITYHSHHGAVQESVHVFIEAGLQYQLAQTAKRPLHLLEMGLGTGLNAMLTFWETTQQERPIHYTALELYPLHRHEWQDLHFTGREDENPLLKQIHESPWQQDAVLSPYFTLKKLQQDLQSFETTKRFDLVYYDAFAPSAQPELWTEAIFSKLFTQMNEGGVLVTYCSKGDVRRSMLAAGFMVEKLPGPKGKREMLRARREI